MRKAVIFGIEALLAVLFAASLVYAVAGAGAQSQRTGFGAWKAKLVAEDIASALAEKAIAGSPDAGRFLEKIRGVYGPGYCVKAKAGGERYETNCGTEGGNRIFARRLFFDGKKFSEIVVEVSYP